MSKPEENKEDKPLEAPPVAPIPPVADGKKDPAEEFLLPSLKGTPILDHLALQLAKHAPEDILYPDRWNWIYEEKPGDPIGIYPNRVEDRNKPGFLGRVYTEGHRIVAWEPWGG